MKRHAVIVSCVLAGTLGARAAPAPTAPTPADRAADAKYAKAMKLGRQATAAHKLAAAIAAFDGALAIKKHDAQALAERGYAKLVGGTDLAGAGADLDRAAGATSNRKLLSQIWFNRGLIDEKSPSTAANAKADFAMANKLSPSAAAAGKLAGATCPVRVSHQLALEDEGIRPIDAGDWLAFAAASPDPTWADGDAPKTAAAAVTALFGAAGAPKLPAIVIVGDDFTGHTAYLVVHIATGLRAVPVGASGGSHCPGMVTFAIAESVGALVHVRGSEIPDGGQTRTCAQGENDHGDCVGDNQVFTGYVCEGGSQTERDLVIDSATGDVVLVAEHPELADKGAAKPLTTTLTAAGLRLAGLDCDRIEPLK